MAKRQPLNNRINKEAMFKKIMPSASARQKAVERPAPSGGDDLMDGLTDDLIDMTVSSFGDDLLDQLPSQPRVFATPAAPTAPVPPPPTVTLPQAEEPPLPIQSPTQPLAPQAEMPAEYTYPQAPMASADSAQPPMAPAPQAPPEWPQEPPHPYVPDVPFAQAQQPPFPTQSQPAPGYVPTQPFAPYPAQYPPGYPYPQYPPAYPPYGYPPPEAQPPAPQHATEHAPADGMPVIEQMASATVLADSASVVTDTVVIQENSPSAASPTRDAPPQADAPQQTPPKAEEPEPAQEPSHLFQPEMEVEDAHLIDDYDAFPPLSEDKGDVVNVVERIVAMWVDDAIRSIHGCNCEKCRLDVAAFALNRLQPQYVLAEDLSEEMIFRRKTVVEAVDMLTKAAFQVKTFPRH